MDQSLESLVDALLEADKRNPDRDYRREHLQYKSKPEQRRKHAARLRARRRLEKKGRVSKHDGKHIDHKDFNPENNSTKNLRVMSASANSARNQWAKRGRK